MAGVKDPTSSDVKPIEPDFEFEEKTETDGTYIPLLLVLLQAFYKRYKGKDPEFILKNIDKDVQQLHDDMEAVIIQKVPEAYQLGAESAVAAAMGIALKRSKEIKDSAEKDLKKATLKKIGMDKKGSKDAVNIDKSLLQQEVSLKGITDEIRNDLKSSAVFVDHRQDKETNLEVKSGNVLNRAVNRIKAMGMYGSRVAYDAGNLAALSIIFNPELMKFNWISMRDDNVCPDCEYFDENSPWAWAELPPCPYHDWCRCEIKPDEETAVFSTFAIALIGSDLLLAPVPIVGKDDEDQDEESQE